MKFILTRRFVTSFVLVALTAATTAAQESEPNDSFVTADPIQCDQALTASISPAGDVDFFTFSMTVAAQVVAEVQCANGDSTLALYNSLGVLQASSDDEGALLCSSITRSLVAGNYYLEVREFADDAAMPYTLVLTCTETAERAPARTPIPVNCGLNLFHASYGDNDQDYDASFGSIDRRDSYTMPSGFVGEDTDDPSSPANRVYPFVLSNYCPFDPASAEFAFLRLDVYYEQRDVYSNDAISFFDDALNASAGGYGFAGPLRTRLIALGQQRNQWVSIVIDLRSGQVYASELDDHGSEMDPYCYGEIGSLTATAARTILNAAADGDLHGRVQDDMRIGYVALYGKAYAPTAPICPDSWYLIKGGDTGGFGGQVPTWLCNSDNSYLTLNSAKSAGKHRVEWHATFTIPADLGTCSMILRSELRTTRKPLDARISMLNVNSGTFVHVATVPCGEVNDIPRDTTIANPSAYINPTTRQVRMIVYIERDSFLIPPFTMNADVLRLTVR